MDAVKICVAERDEIQRSELVEALSNQAGFRIVGSTGNGMQALQMIEEMSPDILICNIVLSACDAFEILEQVQNMKKRPKVLITSSLEMESTIHKAFEKGVDEYLLKPVDTNLLVRRICKLAEDAQAEKRETLRETALEKQPGKALTAEEQARLERIRQSISQLFMRIGVPVHLSGFRFAQEAVLQLVENPMLMRNRIKVLYPEVARRHGTSAFCVERAIRHMINITWERGSAERYQNEYGQTSRLHLPLDKPTSGEFIALLAEYIRSRQRHQEF